MRAVFLSHIICGTNATKNFTNRPHFLTEKMYINYFIKYNIWNNYSNAITLVLSKTLYFTLFIENTKMYLSKVFLKRLAFFDFKLDPYPKSGHCASFRIHTILTIKRQKLQKKTWNRKFVKIESYVKIVGLFIFDLQQLE